MTAKQLAYNVIKYQQRDGWSHRDLLRLAHPKISGDVQDVLHYAVKGWESIGPDAPTQEHLRQIWAFEKAKRATSVDEIVKLIQIYELPRECVPTQFLKETKVWRALLEKMPMTAMIRNLATMTRNGTLSPLSPEVTKVVKELTNAEKLRKARVHPIQLLSALRVYALGGKQAAYVYTRSHGDPFTPISPIKDALEKAFYLSFGSVEPSNKATLLAFDISGSMDMGEVSGVPGLTPREASAAMGMVTARTEPNYHCIAFETHTTAFDISASDSIETVVNKMKRMHMGGTDCSQPMLYALERKLPVDTFIVYTDSETWAGRMQPSQALDQYRQKMGRDAKLIVVGLTATDISIARPGDRNMLDVVGFDTAAPQLITQFAKGEL